MKVIINKIKLHTGGCGIFVALNLLKIFKRDKWVDMDRFGRMYDYGVYLWIDRTCDEWVFLPYMDFPIHGKLVYVGRGVIDVDKLWEARSINHDNDLLTHIINENMDCYMFGCGMTYDESCALEACWILASGKRLSKRKQMEWDGRSLVNKRRERKGEMIAKNILLPYGDNVRFTT